MSVRDQAAAAASARLPDRDLGVPLGDRDLIWWNAFRRICRAVHWTGPGWDYIRNDEATWTCTLRPGHTGPHLAHANDGRVMARSVNPALMVEEGL